MKTQVFEKDVVGKTIDGISTEDHGVVISFTDGTFLLGVGNCYEGVNFEEVFNAEQDACQQFVDVGIMTQEEYSEIVSQRKVAEQARRDAYEKRLTQQRMDNMENMRRVLEQLQALRQGGGLDSSVLTVVEAHIIEVEQSIARLKSQLEATE